MSELKVASCFEFEKVLSGKSNKLFYSKSEADKLIAELEERIACGDRDFEIVNHQNELLLKIVRHHKYKRCEAMAKWCDDRYEDAFERVLSVRDMGSEPSDELTFHLAFFKKWRKRWLELAEKFKEAK